MVSNDDDDGAYLEGCRHGYGNGLVAASQIVEAKAMDLFVKHKDDAAIMMRDLATKLRQTAEEHKKEYDEI